MFSFLFFYFNRGRRYVDMKVISIINNYKYMKSLFIWDLLITANVKITGLRWYFSKQGLQYKFKSYTHVYQKLRNLSTTPKSSKKKFSHGFQILKLFIFFCFKNCFKIHSLSETHNFKFPKKNRNNSLLAVKDWTSLEKFPSDACDSGNYFTHDQQLYSKQHPLCLFFEK